MKIKNILRAAKGKNLTKDDILELIKHILAKIFGYDKYCDLTIKGKLCHLAAKTNGKIRFIVECRAAEMPLKDKHLLRAANIAVKLGINWAVLTNGIDWEIYRLKPGKPVMYDLVLNFNFLDLSEANSEDMEKLYVLSKEGILNGYHEEYYRKIKPVNKFVIGAFILSEPVIAFITEEIRKYSPRLKIDKTRMENIIATRIFKENILKGDEALKAFAGVSKDYRESKKK